MWQAGLSWRNVAVGVSKLMQRTGIHDVDFTHGDCQFFGLNQLAPAVSVLLQMQSKGAVIICCSIKRLVFGGEFNAWLVCLRYIP